MLLSALGATIALVFLSITVAVLIDWQWRIGLNGRDVIWYSLLGAEMFSAAVVLRPRGSRLRFCVPSSRVFQIIGAPAFSFLPGVRPRSRVRGRYAARGLAGDEPYVQASIKTPERAPTPRSALPSPVISVARLGEVFGQLLRARLQTVGVQFLER